jgi:hypothetical protein
MTIDKNRAKCRVKKRKVHEHSESGGMMSENER